MKRGQPLVALTTTSVAEGGVHQKPQILLYSAYIAALEALGLAPALITPMHSARSVQAILERCDGLVLSGGEDVDPRRYGEEPIPELGSVTPARDEMEFTALGLAVDREIPVLGICRGCQVLNVFFGGTLYQDLGKQFDTELRHEQEGPWDTRWHDVYVQEGTKLCDIVRADCLHINSFHHQGVRDVAPSLAVSAVADDGLVEGIESKELPFLLGVQWHPERGEAKAPETDPDRRIFAAFRKAVVERHDRG